MADATNTTGLHVSSIQVGATAGQSQNGQTVNFIQLAPRTSAPTTTTSRLYNLNGVLYFESVNLETGGSGAGTLDDVYSNGATVNVDTGALIFNDATTGAANTFEFNKTGAGSGNILDFDFTAAFTGNVLNLDMGSAVGAVGIVFDSEGGARTGVDALFTDDSTGTHSTIQINKSGAGTSIGFEYVGSYNGSPAGQVFNVDLNASDMLDTEVMQLTTGAGNRNIMFDFNLAHTDSGTTSHVFDIDMTGVFDSNVFDVAFGTTSTGNVFNVVLDNAVAATAIHIEGAGARTQPMFELTTTATGSANLMTFVVNGAISGNLFDVAMSTTSTGNVLDVDMDAAVGSRAIYLDSGAGTRTVALIDILADGAGNSDVFNMDVSNTGASAVFDINISGAGTGLLFDIDVSGAASGNLFDATIGAVLYTGDVISIDLGATATGSQAVVITSGAMTRTTNLINIDENGSASGNTIDIDLGAVTFTGNILDLNLGATATGSQAMVVASGAMTRTTSLFEIGDAGTSSGATFDINHTGITTGIWFDLDATAATTGNVFDFATNSASTGTIFAINMTNAVGAIVANYTLAGIRTVAATKIDDSGTGASAMYDINVSGIQSGIMFDIDLTAAATGNIFDFATNSASTGTIFAVNMTNAVAAKGMLWTTAGTRTENLFTFTDSQAGSVDIMQLDVASTSSGMVFDINVSGNFTGNVLDIVYSASAVQGDAIHIDMATNLAGNAIQIDAANIRTAPLINIVNTATDGGTDDHVVLITQSGLLDSSMVQLTFGTAASTGDAINIIMDTNVAGMGLTISSAGTGVSNEGNAINIAHTGALVAGADVVRISTTGNCSSTSNGLSIEMSGAGTAGTNALHINATGTNVEAIEIEAGLFFEAVTAVATGAGNGETVDSSANVSYYDCGGASRTGVILEAGIRAGQKLVVANVSDANETITFAASGTSNVASGTSCVIEQNIAKTFVWTGAEAPAAMQNLWVAMEN